MKLVYVIYGFLSTFYFLKFLIPFLKEKVIDFPNKRSLHTNPTPTGGGIVFSIQIIIISCFSRDYLPLICLPLSVVGFLDDKFNLSSKIRFLVQIVTSFLIIFFTRINFDGINNLTFNEIIIIIFFIFVFTAFINFVNFMDGIDGLVGSCILVGFLFIALNNDPLIFIFIGTLFGFLKWNWMPAKIFMGDVGSTFLAAYYLLSLLRFDNVENILGFFFSMSPLIFDAAICVLRRLYYKENIFTPHKLHLYQRLCESGLSHSKVTIIYSLACIILGITYTIFGLIQLLGMLSLIIFFGIWLDKNVATKFEISLKS